MSSGTGLPRVGEILRDKYELIRTLGEGGMAVVFEGRNIDTGQRVAIKVLAPELCRDPEIVARFDREARAVGRLRTRHVAHVIEVAATVGGGIPFIVMDFLDGRDLASELEARQSLPIKEAVDYVLQTCAAMDEAHRSGVVHRDLKPANLFLTTESEQRIVKVLDFGISKLIGESSKLTGAGAVMGTVVYMSPEQVKSSTDVDQRADVWSLGVILFELLAGRAPFEGPGHKIAIAIVSTDAPDVRSLAPDANVPEALAQVIRVMLARERDARYSSISEAAHALVPFAAENSVGARIVPTLGRDLPPRGRAATAGKTMPFQKHTVPLGFRPNLGAGGPGGPPSSAAPNSNAAAASQSHGGGGAPVVHAQTFKIDGTAAPNSRRSKGATTGLATVGGAILGLLAAGLVVYIGVLIMQPKPTPLPSTPTTSSSNGPPTNSEASSEASSEPSLPHATTTTTPDHELPPPPPTGTMATTATTAKSSPLATPKDAGGARSPVSPPSLGNPQLL